MLDKGGSSGRSLSISYPFNGKFKITSLFGPRNTGIPGASTDHLGVDLVALEDKTVLAAYDGKVTKIDTKGSSKRGKYIWISQVDGKGTIYQHLADIYVKVGDTVRAGSRIGLMGSTGIGSGAHLHFGVSIKSSWDETMKNRKANAMNPLDYLALTNTNQKVGTVLTGGFVVSTSYGLPQSTSTEPQQKVIELKGVSHDILYGRRYRIFVELDDGSAFDVSTLRCKFSITKSWYQCDNECVVSIYNLSASDENKIIKNGQRIYVEAGYTGSFYGLIYSGNVFQCFRGKENGTDYVLSIVAYDSPSYSLYNVTSTTMIAQATMRQAVDEVTKAIAKGEIATKTSEIVYPRGKVLFGNPNALLQQIKRSIDATYYIDNGKINLIGSSDYADDVVFDLGPDSGLIGSPSQTDQGITCECLLNPIIKLNDLFHIDNAKVKGKKIELGDYQVPLDAEGLYRAIKLEYEGDTRGDDWKTTITALTQAGALPSMAENMGTVIN